MAHKHTAIINQVMIDWTKNNRGTLWHNPQLRIPIGDTKGWTRAGLGSGTADIVGIETAENCIILPNKIIQTDDGIGIWTSIEAKTYCDWLSRDQKNHLCHVTDWGGHYYLALELPGCTIENPKYKLYKVKNIRDLSRVKAEWNGIWGKIK
jgi:hypothetical protein